MHIARHFGYSETETDFLMLLVNYGRAGTTELRSYFLKQIQARREARQVLKSRFQPQKVLSLEHQAIYYSSWHFTAIHVGVTLPGCDTELGIAERFGLSLARVREVVQFLEQAGLIRRQGGKLEIGEMQVFLGSDSPLISKHHSNWRMRAIQSLDTYTERDLHYSAVMACTVEDAALIREKMVKTIEEIRAVVRPSKEEGCYSYCLDFFEVKPT